MSNENVFNTEELMAQFEGDMEILIEVLVDFEEKAIQDVANIRKALAENNYKDLELYSHSLKGAISNFFADKAKGIAFEIEKKARDNNVDGVNSLTDSLEVEVKVLLEALKEFVKEDSAA